MTTRAAALRHATSLATVLSICVLLLNDHVLKWRFASDATGKLGDLAELYFLPSLVLLVIVVPFAWPERLARSAAAAAFVAVGVIYVVVKLDPSAATFIRQFLAPITGGATASIADPSDLLAMPALVLSYVGFRRGLRAPALRLRGRRSAAVPIAALMLFASVANTPGVPPFVQLIGDPVRAGTAYALYVDEDYYGGTYPVGIYRTRDSGASWEPIAAGAEAIAFDAMTGDLVAFDRDEIRRIATNGPALSAAPRLVQSSTVRLYGTRRLALVAPNGAIYAIRDGSLARSSDGGSTWASLTGSSDLRAIAAARTTGLLYAVVGRELRRSTDAGVSWVVVGPLINEYVRLAVDPSDDLRIVAVTDRGVEVSSDGGRAWRSAWSGSSVSGRDFRGSVAFDPDHPERVYSTLGTDVGLLVSGDHGETWRKSDLPALSVGLMRGPEPRILISADYRGVYRNAAPWPALEPWQRASRGLPYR